MSATFTATATALANDPDLQATVMSAGSPEERASILREAGVPVPSHADVNSGVANLADVAGGYDDDLADTWVVLGGGAAALGGIAAAGAAAL